MTNLIFLLACVVFIRGITTLLFLRQSLDWLANKRKNRQKTSNYNPDIYILIPALREQERIIDTLDYFVRHFKSTKTKVIVVTTNREYEKKIIGPSTQELVRNYIDKNKLSDFIKLVNYPKKYGLKAHQINFALKTINSDDSYITVYDADSRPHPDTLKYVIEELGNNNKAKVLLQSAVFIKNYDIFSTRQFVIRYFLTASAILQTRWTLTHELPRLLRQAYSFVGKYAYAHVVGHGMFIQTKLFKSLGGFPTGTITEDLFLGYLLRSKEITIYSIPLLELADSPKTVKGLWEQKYVWFWGPMKTFAYLKCVFINKTKLKINNRLIPIAMTFQNLVSALAWLISGPIILILLLSPFLIHNIYVVLFSYLAVIVYGPLQYFIIINNLSNLFKSAGSYYSRQIIGEALFVSLTSIVAIIFHSIPPYFSLYSEIKGYLDKSDIYKPKTDD